MKLEDLNYEQKQQLKQSLLCAQNENVSYDELANAEQLITDEMLEKEFSGTEFCEEDFY